MKLFISQWRKLTQDPVILDIVENLHVEFYEHFYSVNNEEPCQMHFNNRESEIITLEIEKLIQMGVVIKAEYEKGQFCSPIFVRPKKNGEYRMILNLKKLNEFIPYQHFKMDTFEKALNLISKDIYMGSIDLRHAYYSIGIAVEQQKFFRFCWKNELYQFTACPNGLACMPRLFTKLLKPIFAKLRSEGHVNSGFIDDSLLCGDSYSQCLENISDTESLMEKVGFVVNLEKSVTVPTKRIVFLGNIIDSEKMKVFLPQDKIENIKSESRSLRNLQQAKIRQVAKVIGMFVAAFSAVQYGQLHYRNLERRKSMALKSNKGDFEANMSITTDIKNELDWWINDLDHQYRLISHGNPDVKIQTDASLTGWGAVLDDSKIGGRWNDHEKDDHINALELKAILLTIKSFSSKIIGKHVQILSDSSTAVCYITNMGGIRSERCNEIARNIWLWCIQMSIWLSCTHIAGKLNQADGPSRKFNDRIEWSLDNAIFEQLSNKFGKPDIDLFASRLNAQVSCFCSWKPDPNSSFVDAFSIDWNNFSCAYVFPPFSLMGRCLQKITEDGARCMIVAPLWPTQPWFTKLMKMLIHVPIILPKTKDILHLPHTDVAHPLSKTLVLIACLVSGNHLEIRGFQEKQPTYLCVHGDQQLKNNIKRIYQDGFSTAVNTRCIQFQHLYRK